MHRLAIALPLLLVASPAAAQGYDTALPLDGAERRAVEMRLSTILEFAGTGEVSQFTLPTGRQVTVRPYRAVRGSGGTPCRGYRMDLAGDRGSMAVDGYRCLAEGKAWVITEPETVVARAGFIERPDAGTGRAETTVEDELGGDTPFRRRMAEALGTAAGDPDAARLEGEAMSTGAATFDAGPVAGLGAAPPVPRRPPPRDAASPFSSDDRVSERPAQTSGERPGAALGGLVADALGRAAAPARGVEDAGGQEAALQPDRRGGLIGAAKPLSPAPVTIAPAPDPAGGVADDNPVVAEDEEPAAGEARVAALPPPQARDPRIVDTREPPASRPLETFDDPRIVAALRDLAYLKDGQRPSAAAVQQAVDEFARDEEFALPVAADDLAARLAEALDRSDRLPRCDAPSPATLCVAGAS